MSDPGSLYCPVCGAVYAMGQALTVTISPYAGEYCLTCYAQWISREIPKLEDREDAP